MAERYTIRRQSVGFSVFPEAVEAICNDQRYQDAWLQDIELAFRVGLAEHDIQPITPWDWWVEPHPLDVIRPGAVVIRGDCQALVPVDDRTVNTP